MDYVFKPLAAPDPMERVQILASYAGMVVTLLQAGILTREQAVNEMREMGSGIEVLQDIALQTDPGSDCN